MEKQITEAELEEADGLRSVLGWSAEVGCHGGTTAAAAAAQVVKYVVKLEALQVELRENVRVDVRGRAMGLGKNNDA